MKKKAKKKANKRSAKEPVSELFVGVVARAGMEYGNPEYIQEMLNVGVTERQLPKAAFEFAMDALPTEFFRLNATEQVEVEKRLKKYFKEILK